MSIEDSESLLNPTITTAAGNDTSCMSDQEEDAAPEAEKPQKRRKLPYSLGPSTASGMSGIGTAGASISGENHMHGVKQRIPTLVSKALRFKGRIQLAKTEAQCIWLTGQLLLDKPVAVGFDVEWRVSYETGFPPQKIALVQICYRSRQPGLISDDQGSDAVCLIFQLYHCHLPPVLRTWLQGTVVKAGANIGGDACKLLADYGVTLGGSVDLGAMARIRGGPLASLLNKRGFGLSDMLQEVTGGRFMINKPRGLRTGDWEVLDLTDSQIQYAATDAFASLFVFEAISLMKPSSAYT